MSNLCFSRGGGKWSQNFFIHQNNWFDHKNRTQAKKIGSLIQKSRETAARTGPNRMGGGIPPYKRSKSGLRKVRDVARSIQHTDIVPCNQQTLHAWLLKTLPPTVQTPCKNSIAFPNASLAVTRASDATFMLPAPSDHHMREATTAL